MAIREGKWDCPQCGHTGNRGSDLKCKSCNKQRSDDVEFYLEDDAAEVTDEARLAAASAGADWLCEYCNSSNVATLKSCKSCGAERGAKRREEKVLLDADRAPKAPTSPEPPAPSKKGGLVKWLVAGLAIGAALFICLPTEKQLTVSQVSWERTVELQKLATVTEAAFEDELPSGARVLSRERKFHHNDKIQTGTREVSKEVEEKVQSGTRKVKVGTKNKGNGYFEDVFKDEPVYENRKKTVTETVPVFRDEPVYKEHCRYEIDKWVRDTVERTTGIDKSPKWPEYSLGSRREGEKTETYKVVFKDAGGKSIDWEPSLEKWQRLEVGKGYKVKLIVGKVSDVVF
jgi:hypothetical protein